ncbi:hypothetical protein BGZ61DRAFT_541922 [Ilyonectria robusta]|uniref:uncharacterized protein n=1 Tax=Ilyonectria robusta TaxID=1079257 RepID=UPI001E8CFFF6|nr:uncharacterized protein BGZ61DRAFT_541922 [Ilyonectria robusta]KAH8651975.1 hypothetical protein BGZ61DRAFT_541922 [Ilyonectria robusta]
MAELALSSLSSGPNNSFVGCVRGAFIPLINANPQLGMWQAAGTAIAQAPNLTELRDAESGGENIAFNAQGHSVRFAVRDPDGELTLVRSNTRRPTLTTPNFDSTPGEEPVLFADVDESTREVAASSSEHHPHSHWNLREEHRHLRQRCRSFYEKHKGDAWGAMLFFLLLKAAPAMNHPSADDDNSPGKKWLEIDSQILNALFCVTAFGLAPWRFRDLYLFFRAVHCKDRPAMLKLADQNKSWFRPPAWATEDSTEASETTSAGIVRSATFTGETAPPTPVWELGFPIWMMWEGRKVKKIEGPEVKVFQTEA